MGTPTPNRLYIHQGATLRRPLSVILDGKTAPEDWTGYAARMQVRPSPNSATVYLDLSTANGGIVINGTVVQLTATAAATLNYSFGDKNQGAYEIEMISPSGKVSAPFMGVIELIRAITK